MQFTPEQQHYVATIGSSLVQIGESLLALARMEQAEPERDHYSQEAMDARQYPVLTMFANNDSLPWEGQGGVKRVALANGYKPGGVGGFFTGPNALLAWADENRTHVSLTRAGLQRILEIERRQAAAA